MHANGVYFSELVTRQYLNAIERKEIKLPYLTPAELQVLKYSCTDQTYSEIAVELKMTLGSVKGHRDSMFKKLDIHSREGLVKFAIENGIEITEIPPEGGTKFFRRPAVNQQQPEAQ